MRYIKFKDIFTILNLFLSFYAVILLMQGQFETASYLVMFNVYILDIIDGYVARLTKTSNLFGKHFDSIVDFFGSSMILPFFIYEALKDYNATYAICVAFLPLLSGVLREVMGRIENISLQGYFIGWPRNSSAAMMIAFLNCSLFTQYELFWAAGLLAVILFCYQLSHAPFIGNDKKMLLAMPRLKLYLSLCLILMAGFTWAGIFWDGIVIFMFCFLISPYVLVDKKIWDEIRMQLKAVKIT